MSSTIRTPAEAVRDSADMADILLKGDPSVGMLRARVAVLASYYADLHRAYLALQRQKANADQLLNATFPADDEPIGPVVFQPKDSATPASVQEFVRTAWDSVPVGGGA